MRETYSFLLLLLRINSQSMPDYPKKNQHHEIINKIKYHALLPCNPVFRPGR